ncbi:hypothetical protein P4O66_000432 [Electrophorus voltai]|uniref:Inter-alpha-trypsin inhibitor heavy chain H3 n=1 Tax=Electrophorus voltai TaxID=2609070 RepID=A0AAD8ZI23_9TELE|nr:hypothetical protein P4O66_000432 [Electrophorus voltai]
MATVRITLLLCITLSLCIPSGSYGAVLVSGGTAQQGSGDNTNRLIKIEVHSVKIDCNVASRFAHTVMTSTALNKANVSQEVFFEVELPKTAFITNFSMEIEGKTYVGEVKEKEKAKKQYEKAVSSGQTAGLVKASGRKMEKFSVSVNIAAHSGVTFTLTYEELLQRRFGNYEIMIRVKPKQLIVADIHEPQGIAFLDAYGTFITNELLPLVEKTVTDKKAHVSFSPTIDQQRKCPDCDGTLIDGDFFIKYDVKRTQGIGDVQTKEALLSILKDLPENDYFGIVIFSNDINVWRPYLSQATPENIQLAQKFIMSLQAGGGPRDLPQIQESIRDAIGGNITLFCLGFGYDVDYPFLDVLAKQNNGLARRIYEDSDAVLQLQFQNDFVVKGQASTQERKTTFPDEEYIFGDFTERLWAYLTIQQLLDKKDKGSAEERVNATAEALELSLKYNFVTPLTSMVVIKPQKEEKPEDALIADKLTEVDGDPHFIIELPDQNDALCFNIDEKPGTIFNLVKDPLTGIVVNGQTIGDKKVDPGTRVNTYFGSFGIIHDKFGIRLMVSTQKILVSDHGKVARLFWSDNTSVKGPNMDLQVTKDRSLTVSLRNSVKFVIILHKVWKKHPYHQDYLGFYTLDSHFFSQSVHGLIGQFYNGVEFEVSEVFPGQDEGKPDALMFVKGHRVVVTRS